MKRAREAGFTLLEVMVAVAILAMSLTAIFASEAGAIKMAHRSRKMGLASLLARCKMGEIEEQVATEGLPAIFDSGSDNCCEDAEIDGFTCDYEIEPIILPEDMFTPDEESDPEGQDPGGAAPLDQVKQELESIDSNEVLSGAGVDGLTGMALGLVFPTLKPWFEGQIRRATVTVIWHEGSKSHSFDVTQYLVSEEAVVPTNALGAGP